MKYLVLLLLTALLMKAQAQEFPNDWIGSYEGEMIIGSINSDNHDTVDVSFDLQTIESDSSWTYTMTFDSKRFGKVEKKYKIVARRKGEKKVFTLDENNGIEMHLSYLDGAFYGVYEVMGSMYTTTIRYNNGDIFYDLFVASMQNPRVTTAKGEDEDEEDITATSYGVMLHQTVLLKPIE